MLDRERVLRAMGDGRRSAVDVLKLVNAGGAPFASRVQVSRALAWLVLEGRCGCEGRTRARVYWRAETETEAPF